MKKELTDIAKVIHLYRIGGDGFAVDKGGGITVGFKVTLPEVHNINLGDIHAAASEDGAKGGLNLIVNLQMAIKDLPDGYIFHQQDWQYYADPADIPNMHNYLNQATRKMYGDQKQFNHAAYIFISKKSGIFSSENFSSPSVADFMEQVENFRSKITALAPQRMNTDDWQHYLESVFALNHSATDAKEIYDVDFDKQQFGEHKIAGYTCVGDKTITELYPYLLNPDRSSPSSERYNSWTHPITWGLAIPKVVNNIVVTASKKTINGYVGNFESQISLFNKLMPDAVKQAEEYRAWLKDEKATPVLHHFSVFYFFPPSISREDTERKIRAAFSRLHLKPTKVTVNTIADGFLKTVGGCATTLQYPQSLYPAFLDEAVCFSNLEGSHQQNKNGIVFADPMGQPIVKDLFFEPYAKNIISNWNMNIVAPSGRGKSVLTNYILSAIHFMDFFIVVIDIGGSYESLCKLLKGQYIKLDAEGKALSTNPFLLPLVDPTTSEGYGIIQDELNSLMSILFIAWDTDLSLKVENQNSRAVLEDLLKAFYKQRYDERREYVCFDDFFEFVEEEEKKKRINQDFFNIASFLLIMKKFSKRRGGSLGFLFNGEQNLNDFSKYRMIVFELEDISKNETLFSLVSAMIVMLANRIVQKSRARFRTLWLDECWFMLRDIRFALFVFMSSKTLRKMQFCYRSSSKTEVSEEL